MSDYKCQPEEPPTHKLDDSEYQRSILELGHLIKYNFYMLTKSVIFHAVSQSVETPEEAIEATNSIVEKLDLEFQKYRGTPPGDE